MKRILIIDRRHSFEYKVLTEDKEQYSVKNYICDFVEGAGNEE